MSLHADGGSYVAFAAGLLLTLGTASSIIGALVVPRRVQSWVTKVVDRLLDVAFLVALRGVRSFERRDRILGWQAPLALIVRLTVWMALLILGFALMMMHSTGGDFSASVRDASSSMFTLGFAVPHGGDGQVLAYLAGFTGMVVVGLQVGYLPTLYASFNRRETEVTLLTARAGLPAWGPEILLRISWGTGDVDNAEVLDDLFVGWERWTAEVAESHATYSALLRLRSPRVKSHWLTSLIAIMDAAAMHLALAPDREPKISARLVLRMGFTTLADMAESIHLQLPAQQAIDDGTVPISITFEEFSAAVDELRSIGYAATTTTAEEAWPHFRGWRANYDAAALALCRQLDAPPSLWTGPRRWPSTPMAPARPALGRRRPS